VIRCAEPHPDATTACTLPPGRHWEHDDDHRRWPNAEIQAAYARPEPTGDMTSRARQVASAIAPRTSTRMSVAPAPDPVEPEPGSPAALVLAHLMPRVGGWTTGTELIAVAGPTGPHQPHELRRAGWLVESRFRDGVWEHRVPVRARRRDDR
jgi:hypothetical protein